MASVNDLAERVAKLETTVELGFKHLAERLDALALELSDQGRTPAPKESGGWKVSLAPGSGRQIAVAILLTLAGLGVGIPSGMLFGGEPDQEPGPVAAPAAP